MENLHDTTWRPSKKKTRGSSSVQRSYKIVYYCIWPLVSFYGWLIPIISFLQTASFTNVNMTGSTDIWGVGGMQVTWNENDFQDFGGHFDKNMTSASILPVVARGEKMSLTTG